MATKEVITASLNVSSAITMWPGLSHYNVILVTKEVITAKSKKII